MSKSHTAVELSCISVDMLQCKCVLKRESHWDGTMYVNDTNVIHASEEDFPPLWFLSSEFQHSVLIELYPKWRNIFLFSDSFSRWDQTIFQKYCDNTSLNSKQKKNPKKLYHIFYIFIVQFMWKTVTRASTTQFSWLFNSSNAKSHLQYRKFVNFIVKSHLVWHSKRID